MLIVPAHAKLNLGLAVIGRRGDGFHDIDSLAVPLDWHDIVGVSIGPGEGVRFRMTGAVRGVPAAETNLAHRAATALGTMLPSGCQVAVWLDKRLPTAAGLGGGSTDAAAVLRAGIHLAPSAAGRPLDIERVRAVAADLGSDVPATLATWPVRLRGRGDVVDPAEVPAAWLAVAVAGVSHTPATYAALDAAEMGETARIGRLAAAAASGYIDDTLCGSALEAAACRVNPPLAEALGILRENTGAVWHLTGSGGAAFALGKTRAWTMDVVARARALGVTARLCRTVSSPLPR